MIYRFFVLRDRQMNLYMPPMTFQSKGQAIRAIQDEIKRPVQGGEPQTTLQSHPEDLSLYEVGEYDNESGCVIGHPSPVLVMECSELSK